MPRLNATTRTATLVLALSMLAASAALAAGPTTRGESVRHDVLATIDAYRLLLDTPATSPGIIDGLDDARTQIETLPEEGFATLDPALLRRLQRLQELAAQVSAAIAAKGVNGRTDRGDDFPVADYPEISFDFVIHGALGVPPEGPTSGFRFGLCTVDMAPNAEMKFTLLNANKLGLALRDTARRFCEQTVIILGEGANLSPICIISDIAYLIIRGIQDNMFLCGSSMTGAEISGSYARLDHLHHDLSAAQSNLLARIGVTQANLITAANLNEAHIRDIVLDLARHDLNLQQRMGGVSAGLDELEEVLAAFRAEELRLRIECALADAEAMGIGELLLPDALGGHLELVDFIVADTITAVVDAGFGVGNAGRLLDGARRLAMRGEFADAYDRYGQAYRAATR